MELTTSTWRSGPRYAGGVPATTYHHGNLRQALIDVAVEVARAAGPSALTVRDLARRVGVSHNAAYRHFADREALVAVVADLTMSHLVDRLRAGMDAVDDPDPVRRARRRLAAVGRAYVQFALGEPGLFRLAFAATEGLPEGRPAVPPGAADPYGLLTAALDDLAAVGFLHPDARAGAETTCWSAVHGFSLLHVEGPLQTVPAPERAEALEGVLASIDRSYAATTGATVDPHDLRPTPRA